MALNLRLHHVNLATADMHALNDFYEKTLGLERIDPTGTLVEIDGWSGRDEEGAVTHQSTFFSAGDRENLQLHTVVEDPYLGQRRDMPVNPLHGGHIAFRCDDIEELKARLDRDGIPYADYGTWGVKG